MLLTPRNINVIFILLKFLVFTFFNLREKTKARFKPRAERAYLG